MIEKWDGTLGSLHQAVLSMTHGNSMPYKIEVVHAVYRKMQSMIPRGEVSKDLLFMGIPVMINRYFPDDMVYILPDEKREEII